MSSHFGHLFVIDRSIDLASVLLSPVTYEALLDEVFGISCGVVDFSLSDAAASDDKLKSTKLQLSSRDGVFNNIRYKHFASIFAYLSSNAKQLKASQGRASNMSVTEMKQFVQDNLRSMQVRT